MNIEPLHEEEAFGILSSDNIYLDCILVKPKVLEDTDIEALYIWVPKYPLTKTTLINCARHEINAEWREGKAAHLVFDLRGTGDSDGTLGDRNFQSDLKGIEIWAGERFGNVDLVILGRPEGQGKAHIFPVRPGVIIEYYHYPAAAGSAEKSDKPSTSPIPLLYLATPGNFSVIDDALCQRLAQAGYDVYGLDPLRYLLHASSKKRLTPADILGDMEIFCHHLPANPIIIGQPVSAGLALLWASGIEQFRGVISIGKAQAAFEPWHIFDNDNPHSFFINRHLYRISPRPIVFVMIEDYDLGGEPREIAGFYASAAHPRLAERTREVSPRFLLKLLAWIEKESQQMLDES